MQRHFIFIASFIFIAFLFNQFLVAQTFSANKDSHVYWQERMSNPNLNYFQLVDDFDNYWKNKSVKPKWHKFFERWKIETETKVNHNGHILSPQEIKNEFESFLNKYPIDGIIGNWDFVGPSDFPVPLYSGQICALGRISAIAFHPSDPDIILVGAARGGVWRTNNGGNSWYNINTDQLPHLAVSAILIDPDNPSRIWIGTGDRDSDRYDNIGMGVFVSNNGGTSWEESNTNMGHVEVSKLLMHPTSHNIILAATRDGIFRSTNSGSTWTQMGGTYGVYSMIYDMDFKPGDPEIVYCATSTNFCKSIDNGQTWSIVTNGINKQGRGAIGVTPANPNKVYYFQSGSNPKKLFYSNNSGDSFDLFTDNTAFKSEEDYEGQDNYNIDIAIDPTNANILYGGMITLWKSTNGGENWTQNAHGGIIHFDQHLIEFSPHNGNLYVGNDGGMFVTSDGGINWNVISDGLEISMVYRMDVSSSNPNQIIYGTQDGGSYVTYGNQFFHQRSGDGMHCIIDPNNDNIMYTSAQYGKIGRSLTGGNGGHNFSEIANEANGMTEEGDWVTPYCLDWSNSNNLFIGYKDVFRSTNVKTPDATDVTWQNISAGSFPGDEILLLVQSPANQNLMFAATETSNKIFRCLNAHAANPVWIEINNQAGGKPQWIECHPTNEDILYLAVSQEIWKSTDGGNNWNEITANLPPVGINCIIYQKNTNDLIYLGTNAGVYYRDSEMNNWELYKSGIPTNVPIKDLKIHYNSNPAWLYAATYGRGIWKTEIVPIVYPNLEALSGSATVDGTQVDMQLGAKNNSSNADCSNVDVSFYLSDNIHISNNDYLIAKDTVEYWYPGVILSFEQNIDVEYINPPIPKGTYYIGGYIDPDNNIDETDETDNNITVSSQVTLEQPLIPLNVTASDGTFGDKIVVSWDPPAGTSGVLWYLVYRNTYNNPNTAVSLGTVWTSNTTYWDNIQTENGIDYYYWVKASYNYKGYRSSAFSSYDIGWQYLNPPINVEASKGDFDDKIKITWDPPQNGTHFKVWKNTSTNINTADPLSTNWTPNDYFYDYDVELGETYFYWVKAARSSTGSRPSPNYSSYTTGYLALTDVPVVTATDGDYTDRIDITWNAVSGASYYRLSGSYENDPENSNPMTAWTNATSHSDGGASKGVYRYYWVQAATSIQGGNPTGYGTGDSGWRKLEEVENVQAADGISKDHIEIEWDNNNWAQYYKVYRHTNYFFEDAPPVSNWIEQEEFNDSTASPGTDWIYWVLCANDTTLTSDFQAYGNEGTGWRKFYEPEVYATDGVYNDKVVITWDPVFGESGAYQVGRGPKFSNSPTEILHEWSHLLEYEFTDNNVVEGEEYEYFVAAAYNLYGYHAGEYGQDRGVADECANITEDPNTSYRNIDITGNILTINHRILNNGPHSTNESFYVAYLLSEYQSGNTEAQIGDIEIPTIAAGSHYDQSVSINLETYFNEPLPQGDYKVSVVYNSWGNICETNLLDNVFHWENPLIQYTDAMYSEYTIGGTSPDYENFSEAVDDLIERGISGGVIFNVRPESYYEQISIPLITGSSADNYIKFRAESGHTDTAEINFANPVDNYVIQFDGSNNIIFEKIKITNPGYSDYQSTYARCIEIGQGSDNITIEDCRITGLAATSQNSLDIAVIYSYTPQCSNISFIDNKIENGSYGIYMQGEESGDDDIFDIQISNNQIINFQEYGIFLEQLKNLDISGNLIQNSGSGVNISKGIHLDVIEDGILVEGNNVIITMDTDEYYIRGFDFRYCKGTEETQGIIANNMLAIHSDASTTCSGFAFYRANNVGVFNNTVNISGVPLENDYTMFIEGSSSDTYQNVEIINNIFSNMKGGFAVFYGHGAFNSNYIDVMDYNDIYSSEDYLIFHNQEDSLTTIDEWYPLSGFGEHSVSCDPLYLSDADLHVQSSGINDIALPSAEVTNDIDGDSRHPLFPDIGADEFFPPPLDYDIFVNDIISPETAYDLSDQEIVQIELYNVGANDVSNFPVSYRINGGAKITETVTETLESGNVLWYSFTATANLTDTGNYVITAKTELANDMNGANDTYTETISNLLPYNCIPLFGMGCSGNSGIEDFHFGGLVHNGSGCSENGYGDFTNYTTWAYQGESYQMEISLGFGEQYVSMWIDLNDDLIFDDDEKFVNDLYCTNGNQIYSATVDIPISALPGTHRLRVRCAWQQTDVHPCNYYQWGEAHDYNIDIFTGGDMWVFQTSFDTDCSGTPVEIFIDADGGAEPKTYLWSTGETTETILVSPEETTGYKVIITDADGYLGSDTAFVNVNPKPTVVPGGTTWLCEDDNLQLNGSGTAYGYMLAYCSSNCDMPTGYCTSGATSSSNSIIEEVKIGNITNNTAGNCATYSDFTNLSATVVKNDAIDLEITIGTCGADITKGAKIFVDWNRDGDFDDFWEDAAECWPVDTTTTHLTSLWIPDEAVIGNTLMRIVAVETMDTWSIPACGTYSFGETEDYTLNIAETTTNQVLSYDWSGPNGFVSTLQNPLIENVVAADSGYYYLSVMDGNSCGNTDSIFVYIQPTEFIIAGTDTTICEFEVYKPMPEVNDFYTMIWTTTGTGYFDTIDIKSPSYYPSGDDIQNGSVELTLTSYPMTQCADSLYSSFTLSFQQAPYAEIPVGGEICGNESYQVSGVSVHNQSSYYWTTSGMGTFNDTTILNPIYSPSPTDVENGFVDLMINLIGTEPCAATSFPISLFIQKEPLVYSGEDTTICSNGSLSLLSAYATDFDSLKWFTTGTGFFLDKYMENTEYFPSQADIIAGLVNLQLVCYPMMPCSDSVVSELSLTIVEETFADAGGSGMICANESFFLTEATASGFILLQWETSGTGSFNDPNSLNPEYIPGIDETGMIILTLTAFGTSPCGNVSSPVYLDIMPAPEVYAGENASIQSGESYFLFEAMASDYIMLEWSTDGTGTFDDPYMLNPTYFAGTGETGDVELTLIAYGSWPCDSVTSSLTLSVLGGYDLDIKVFLEGPFNGTDMNTDLNSILPLSQPYGSSPWNYLGGETTTLIPDPNIVDWILVELRDASDASLATPGTIIAQQAAFVRNNGQVVGVDGSSQLHFEESFTENLYVVIWHRNHIGIISANILDGSSGTYSYDFTTNDLKVLGGSTGYKQLIPGTWGLAGGNADADGIIGNSDKIIWQQNVGKTGYRVSDFNMDQQSDNKDKNEIWLKSIGKESQVPE